VKSLESQLRGLRDAGRKALVPYFMGGLTPDWTRHVEAAVHAGADAVEIGVPFSDPMMDGVVIQKAALQALAAGTTLDSICADLEHLSTSVPLIAMTYYNVILHYGLERSAGQLQISGISGAIVPDLTLEESDDWRVACRDRDVATVFLVAPSTPTERIRLIATATEGFAYASARMAVTGKSTGAGDGARVVRLVRDVSTVPTYVGIGIGTPQQGRQAAAASDGIIVGSALVQVILAGGGADEVERFVRSFREAIDDEVPLA
jgi:tryptophan synthase alpha chain